MSGVISLLIWVIGIVTLLITLLITTHEPPSSLPFTFNHRLRPSLQFSVHSLNKGLLVFYQLAP